MSINLDFTVFSLLNVMNTLEQKRVVLLSQKSVKSVKFQSKSRLTNITHYVIFGYIEGGVFLVRSLNIPDKLYSRLQVIAEKKGITVSALIKMACSEYLEREEKK